MIDIRKVLKVCEQSDGCVLYFSAHPNADYNPVRKPEEGDYCTPYFFKADTLEEAIRQRDSLISVFDRAFEFNKVIESAEPIHLKAPPEDRVKKSAAALLEMNYPENLKTKMRDAFTEGRYKDILEMAANHDLSNRESLDSKITQIPNPDFKMIKGNVIEMTTGDVDANKISPFLFKAEGIDDTFTSAAEAITAYKKKNNISMPDSSKHQIKKNHMDIADFEKRKAEREMPALCEGE